MTATLTPTPKQQFFDANGNPLVGGKLYSYSAGTTSPVVTYVDSAGVTTNTNPIILDSRGEANVWLGTGTFKFKLVSATDVEIWTVDNIPGAPAANAALVALAASDGSSLVGYLPAGTGAVATTVQTKLRESVSVLDFGADPTGVTSSNNALNNAISALVAIGGGTLLIPDRCDLLITGTINLPRTVNLVGAGSSTSYISCSTQGYINVAGSNTTWSHMIKGIYFNKVGIVYGATVSDYGNGCVLSECEITSPAVGVEYINNCWVTTIDKTSIHGCATGVKFSLGAAVSNSGAACRITSSQIFDSVIGVDLIGSSVDGHNILISDTDIEHCDYSIQSNSGDGSINCVNVHFELNNYAYFNITGTDNVFLTNCWMFPGTAGTWIANFVLTSGVINVISGRIQWNPNALVKNTGGIFRISNQSSVTGSLFGVANPANLSGTAGVTYLQGETASKVISGGSVASAASYTLFSTYPLDNNVYEITATINVTATGAGNALRFTLNPGGAVNMDFTLPNTTGTALVKLVTDWQKTQVTVQYSGGYVSYQEAVQPNAISVQKFFDFKNIGTATMAIYDIVTKVI